MIEVKATLTHFQSPSSIFLFLHPLLIAFYVAVLMHITFIEFQTQNDTSINFALRNHMYFKEIRKENYLLYLCMFSVLMLFICSRGFSFSLMSFYLYRKNYFSAFPCNVIYYEKNSYFLTAGENLCLAFILKEYFL